MSALPHPGNPDTLSAARVFARSLNILLKNIRLYGLAHKRCASELEITWKELQNALADQNGLVLGVASDTLLVDGAPLASGVAERNFAQTLSAAGIHSIRFSQNAIEEELRLLVTALASPRSTDRLDAVHSALPEGSGIRVNEIRASRDAQLAETLSTSPSPASVMAQARSETVGPAKEPASAPQLTTGMESGGGDLRSNVGPRIAPGHKIVAPPGAEDVAAVIGFFGRVLRLTKAPEIAELQGQIAGLPPKARDLLQRAFFADATCGPKDGQQAPDLIEIAEQVAIRFAVESCERGEVKFRGLREWLLHSIATELEPLRKAFTAADGKLSPAQESYGQVLVRRFWAQLPHWAKRAVLLSEDCWCINSGDIGDFIEELLERRDTASGAQVLRNYLGFIEHVEPEVRRRVAQGVASMADLCTRIDPGLLQLAILRAGKQLSTEPSLEIQTELSTTFVRLSQQAALQRNFIALEQCLASLTRLEKSNPGLARGLKPRVAIENRLRDFVAGVRSAPAIPNGLVEVLRRAPRAAAEEIALQFGSCITREGCNRYADLLGLIGPEAVDHLRTILQTRPPSDAANQLGLLSRFDLALLSADLPDRIRRWTRPQQETAIRQIAAAASAGYANLLLDLLPLLDPLIVPRTLDEVGLSNEEFNPAMLISLASGGGIAADAPYVRLKAIEALGRLRAQSAERLLIEILVSKGLLGWHYPRELRVAAAQALERIDPQHAVHLIAKSGLATEELSLRPLDASPENGWVRQRRYPRVALQSLGATAMTNRSKCRVSLQRLSLGGGLAARVTRGPLASDAVLEFQCGMHPLRTRVLMAEGQDGNLSFEIADISLEERSRLRRIIAQHLRRASTATASS